MLMKLLWNHLDCAIPRRPSDAGLRQGGGGDTPECVQESRALGGRGVGFIKAKACWDAAV